MRVRDKGLGYVSPTYIVRTLEGNSFSHHSETGPAYVSKPGYTTWELAGVKIHAERNPKYWWEEKK